MNNNRVKYFVRNALKKTLDHTFISMEPHEMKTLWCIIYLIAIYIYKHRSLPHSKRDKSVKVYVAVLFHVFTTTVVFPTDRWGRVRMVRYSFGGNLKISPLDVPTSYTQRLELYSNQGHVWVLFFLVKSINMQCLWNEEWVCFPESAHRLQAELLTTYLGSVEH